MTTDKRVLTSNHITLRPAQPHDIPKIHAILQDDEICRYMLYPTPATFSDTEKILENYGLIPSEHQTGFVLVWNDTNETIGATRLMDFRPQDFQAEIGSTFVSKKFWRTAANTEMKLLLLTYCFEELNFVRVAFKCDARNTRSQNAILRLGAVQEGILRKNMNVKGYQRDTVYFSVLKEEWDNVKNNLIEKLTRS